jgi:gliding motility-associated-like protein
MITEDITNLISGNYILQVTDGLGCVNFYDTTLIEPSQIIITPTIIDSDCNLCNGEISVILSGGTGVLVPTWNNGSNGTLIQNLCPGIFEISVTDDNGCSITDQITINNTSGLTANAVVNAITCNNSCDGIITVSGSGGTAPYTFNWLNFTSSNSSESNLCADTYFIEVTDATGCISPLEVDLLEPAPFTVTDVQTPPDCGVNNGQISITSSGGSLPHSYLWSTSAVTPVISNLSAGTYTLIVTDNNGCSQNFTFTLGNITAPDVVLTTTNLLCAGDCIGQISSAVTGGTPAYTYQWIDNTGLPIIGEISPTITGLCADNFTLEVTDNAGCINYETTTISQPDTILLNTPFIIDPPCFGDCNGTITINPLGGSQPFTYLWDDPTNQTVLNPIGLCSGVYNVIITDANGCIANQNANLIDPPALIVSLDSIFDATCVNSTNGSVFITVTGGTLPISIEWTNNSTTDTLFTEDIINVLPLIYYVSVVDANGCSILDTFNVDTLLTVLGSAGNDTIICHESSLTLNGTSNQANSDYTWYDINGIQISDTSELIIPNQIPGSNDYILIVSYGGCDHVDTVNVITQNQITAAAGPDIEMFSNETEVIGGTPTTNNLNNTFIWTPGLYLNDSTVSNPSVIEPDEDTWYMVTIIDSIGCINFDSIYVEVIPTLIIPNGISPNGDGKNETWQLLFNGDFPDMEVSVYNRWGDLLFYDNNGYANEWDGKFKQEDLPIGTYYYVIDVHHVMYPDPFTGPITIMR